MFKYSRMENKSDIIILTVRYNLDKDLKYIYQLKNTEQC